MPNLQVVFFMAMALPACWGFSQDPSDSRTPLPDPAKVKDAERLVRDVFKEDYEKRSAADRKALSKKLLQHGIESKDDPATTYFLFKEASVVAGQAGDVETGLLALDELGRRFQGDVLGLKQSLLAEVARTAKAGEEQKLVAEGYLSLSAQAFAAEAFDVAEQAAAAAIVAARKAKDLPTLSRAEARSKELATAKAAAEGVKKARETLLKTPDDPAANLAVGRYECFLRDNWISGLPFLAKGSDPALKNLAARDQTRPVEAGDQTALGDAWWDLADKESGDAKKILRRRAASWYQAALERLNGLTRAKAEKRIADAGPLTPELRRMAPSSKPRPGVIDLLRFVDVKRDSVGTPWVHETDGLVSPASADTGRLQIPYVPGEEYDFVIVARRRSPKGGLNVGLVGGGAQFTVAIDIANGPVTGIGTLDGKHSDANESTVRAFKVFADDQPKQLVFQIRKEGLTFLCDSHLVLAWKGDFSRCAVHPVNAVPNKQILFLASKNAELFFTQASLVPIRGIGRAVHGSEK